MDSPAFKALVFDEFPTDMPDASRLFEGIRIESGHEKLRCLTSVEWPEISINLISSIAGEFWQLSPVWMKYYLPAFMVLTANIKLDVQIYGKEEEQHLEIINDDHDSLFLCLFGYWCSITNFIHLNHNIKDNCYYGLTKQQAGLIEIWLQNMDFITLNKADMLPEDFDFSYENLTKFISKVKKHSI